METVHLNVVDINPVVDTVNCRRSTLYFLLLLHKRPVKNPPFVFFYHSRYLYSGFSTPYDYRRNCYKIAV